MILSKWTILFLTIIVCGCVAPHYIWKQKDMAPVEINAPGLEHRLLIASRDSEFKQALVDKIQDAFSDKSTYIKIIGVESLVDEDARAYSVVLIINTAMGWTVDIPVEKFLKKFGELDTIIVLTTADGADVYPDLKDRNIDAISSASVMEQTNTLADTLTTKIDDLLKRQSVSGQ